MSCYDWESGTITLPSKDVAPLRKALRNAHNDLRALAHARAKELHAKASPRRHDRAQDAATINALVEPASRITPVEATGGHRIRTTSSASTKTALATRVDNLAVTVLLYQHSPRVPTAADMDREWKRLTIKDTRFPVYDDFGDDVAELYFQGRDVEWNVHENNRATKSARACLLGEVFFDYLAKVEWTRGSGGYIVGNDEYNDGGGLGGGGNYLVQAFGPAGAKVEKKYGMSLR